MVVANVVVVMAERAGSARVSWGSSAPPIPVASAAPAMPTTASAPPMMAAIGGRFVPSASVLGGRRAAGPIVLVAVGPSPATPLGRRSPQVGLAGCRADDRAGWVPPRLGLPASPHGPPDSLHSPPSHRVGSSSSTASVVAPLWLPGIVAHRRCLRWRPIRSRPSRRRPRRSRRRRPTCRRSPTRRPGAAPREGRPRRRRPPGPRAATPDWPIAAGSANQAASTPTSSPPGVGSSRALAWGSSRAPASTGGGGGGRAVGSEQRRAERHGELREGSATIGSPRRLETSSPNSGMRDEPPTNSATWTSAGASSDTAIVCGHHVDGSHQRRADVASRSARRIGTQVERWGSGHLDGRVRGWTRAIPWPPGRRPASAGVQPCPRRRRGAPSAARGRARRRRGRRRRRRTPHRRGRPARPAVPRRRSRRACGARS